MFNRIDESFLASPQIEPAQLQDALALGVTLIINNRPEDESADQTPGSEIEAAARAAGLDYVAIPVTNAGFSAPQVEAMAQALAGAQGPVLAYCRSGTRSTLLWALAQASRGVPVDVLAQKAAGGGYDIAPVRQICEMLAARA